MMLGSSSKRAVGGARMRAGGARVRRVLGASLVAVSGLGLIGCAGSQELQSKYEQALLENSELRNALDRARNEQNRLASENQRLAGDLESAMAQPASNQADPQGFQGLAGVDVERRGNDVVVNVAGDVLFDPGKATLKNEAQRTLDQIARDIRSNYGSAMIRIEGYTDPDPIRKSQWESNEHLSAARALAVEKYLVGKGLDNDRIYSAAFGPSYQKDSKARSRRVEIVLLDS